MGWSTTSTSSANRETIASASRAANAASSRATYAVAAFGRTRRRAICTGAADGRSDRVDSLLRVAPLRARSASSVAPFASQSSIARFSSVSASALRPAARSATASAWRASAWSSRSSVAAAISTAARANSMAPACSPRARQRLGAHAAPGDRRLEGVAGERLALEADGLGLGDAALREQRAAEQGGGLRGVDAEPLRAEPVVGGAQAALGGDGVAFEQLDQAGEQVGLEHALRDAELFDHAPRRRDHAPRRLGASAQRLEHGLTAQRDGLDRGRALRDAQHAHDVEAAAAGARDRARSPERGDRRAGEHGVGAAAIVRAARGGERLVERRLAGADLAELREHERVHRVRLRLARGVAGGRQRRRPRLPPRRRWRAAPADP